MSHRAARARAAAGRGVVALAVAAASAGCGEDTRAPPPDPVVEIHLQFPVGEVREAHQTHLTVLDEVVFLTCENIIGRRDLSRQTATKGLIVLDADDRYRFRLGPTRASAEPNPWGAAFLLVDIQLDVQVNGGSVLHTAQQGCACVRQRDADPPFGAWEGLDALIETTCPRTVDGLARVDVPIRSAYPPQVRLEPCHGPRELVLLPDGGYPLDVDALCLIDGQVRRRIPDVQPVLTRLVTPDDPDPPWVPRSTPLQLPRPIPVGRTDAVVELRLPGQTIALELPVRPREPVGLEARPALPFPGRTSLLVEPLPVDTTTRSTSRAQQLAVVTEHGARLELSWVSAVADALTIRAQAPPHPWADERSPAMRAFVHPHLGPLLALATQSDTGPVFRVLQPPAAGRPGRLVFDPSAACERIDCRCPSPVRASLFAGLPVMTTGDMDGDGVEDVALSLDGEQKLIRYFGRSSSTAVFRPDCPVTSFEHRVAGMTLARMGGPGPGDDLLVNDGTTTLVYWSCPTCGEPRPLPGLAGGPVHLGRVRFPGRPIDSITMSQWMFICLPDAEGDLPTCTRSPLMASTSGDVDGDGQLDAIGSRIYFGAAASAYQEVPAQCGWQDDIRHAADLDGDGRSDIITPCRDRLTWIRSTPP